MERSTIALLLAMILVASCTLSPRNNESSSLINADSNDTIAPKTSPKGNNSDIEDATKRPPSKADADVLFVKAHNDGNSWTFEVTVVHPDKGWDDYADGWDVVLPDGSVVIPPGQSKFTRLLTHPHENNVPFIRDQSGIVILDGVSKVTVRAHDLIDGYGGKEIVVDLTKKSGEGFEVS